MLLFESRAEQRWRPSEVLVDGQSSLNVSSSFPDMRAFHAELSKGRVILPAANAHNGRSRMMLCRYLAALNASALACRIVRLLTAYYDADHCTAGITRPANARGLGGQ